MFGKYYYHFDNYLHGKNTKSIYNQKKKKKKETLVCLSQNGSITGISGLSACFLFFIVFFSCVPNEKGKSSSPYGAVEMNPTSIHEDVGSIPGLTHLVKDPALL